uniref:Uncharacterized protein n=1 Tax=Fusarium oxysporum (strain Fo5176) TaxID=660025 RepID=A0A0D2YG96_FUSOF
MTRKNADIKIEKQKRFGRTISETIVLKTPIFPFNAPAQKRKKNATPSDLEKPIPSADKDEPPSPINKTLFLPQSRMVSRSPPPHRRKTLSRSKCSSDITHLLRNFRRINIGIEPLELKEEI